MQSTYELNYGATPLTYFARRKTMKRSEKRRTSAYRPSGSGGDTSPRNQGSRPPRPAGAPYIILTIVLLLLLWPIGLILLWQRRLRWGAPTKLFVSALTMMLCILILGGALTVQVDNPRVTAMQNSVIGFLTDTADAVVDFGVDMGARAERSFIALNDIGALCRTQGFTHLADAIDQAVSFSGNLRGETTAPETDTMPAPSGMVVAPTPSATAQPRPTSVPASIPGVSSQDDALPVYMPEQAPTGGTDIEEGMLTRSGELEPGPLPSPTPELVPMTVALKPAGEATVYFNIGSGSFYHMNSECGTMKNADAHSFAETADNIHEPCERCKPPEKSLLEEKYIVWVDENEVAHTSDECPAFEGQWMLYTAEDVIKARCETCPVCGADAYIAAIAAGEEVTLITPAEAGEDIAVTAADAEAGDDIADSDDEATAADAGADEDIAESDAPIAPTPTPTLLPMPGTKV